MSHIPAERCPSTFALVFAYHPLHHKIEMSRFLTTASLLLCLLNHGTDMATAWDDRDFFSSCPPIRCSKDGPEIRFPLWLKSANSSRLCGVGATACVNLSCSGQDTILRHPFLGPSRVTALDYHNSLMRITPTTTSLVDQQFSECPILQKLKSLPAHVEDSSCYLSSQPGKLVVCSREFIHEHATDYIAGPIPCLSNPGHFTYLVHASLLLSLLPLDCKALSNTVVPIPLLMSYEDTFKQRAEAIIGFSEITTSWSELSNFTYFCKACESRGRRCAFSSQRHEPFCMPNRGIISD